MNERTEALCAQAVATIRNKTEELAKGRPTEDSVQLVEAIALSQSRAHWRSQALAIEVDAAHYRAIVSHIHDVKRTADRLDAIRVSPDGVTSDNWQKALTDRDEARDDLVTLCLAQEYPEAEDASAKAAPVDPDETRGDALVER